MKGTGEWKNPATSSVVYAGYQALLKQWNLGEKIYWKTIT
jgi:hypothetical protein